MGVLILITALTAVGIWLVRKPPEIYKIVGSASLVISLCLTGILVTSYDVSNKNNEISGTANSNVSETLVEQQK